MRQIRSRDTEPEKEVRRVLHSMGYRFRLHRSDLPGKPDVVLPKYHVAVLVHGCFWHGHDCGGGRIPKSNVEYWSAKIARNVKRDALTQARLQEIGWNPVVIWACEIRDQADLKARFETLLHR